MSAISNQEMGPEVTKTQKEENHVPDLSPSDT